MATKVANFFLKKNHQYVKYSILSNFNNWTATSQGSV